MGTHALCLMMTRVQMERKIESMCAVKVRCIRKKSTPQQLNHCSKGSESEKDKEEEEEESTAAAATAVV